MIIIITWEHTKHRAIRLSKRKQKQLILKIQILADVIQKTQICILFHRLITLNLPMCILCKKEEIQHSNMDFSHPKHKEVFYSFLSVYYTSNNRLVTSKLGVKIIYTVKSPLIFYVKNLNQPNTFSPSFNALSSLG